MKHSPQVYSSLLALALVSFSNFSYAETKVVSVTCVNKKTGVITIRPKRCSNLNNEVKINDISELQAILGINPSATPTPTVPPTAGLTGEQGPQGPKGDTGATGPQGPQGIQGEKGDKGDTGAAGLDGTLGAQGPKGDKGEKGEKGDQRRSRSQGRSRNTRPKG